ncbi:MAG: hypothetical protein AAGB51_05235 [Planctomycetota bacterium]
MLAATASQAAEPTGGASADAVILALLGVGGVFTIGLLVVLMVLLRHIPSGKKPVAEPEAVSKPDAPLKAGSESPDGATVIKLE